MTKQNSGIEGLPIGVEVSSRQPDPGFTGRPLNLRQYDEAGSEHAAFYREHYSAWTVHELSLVLYVPTKSEDREFALDLVREILNEAAFDIRLSELRTQLE